jgi:hypothetical protein
MDHFITGSFLLKIVHIGNPYLCQGDDVCAKHVGKFGKAEGFYGTTLKYQGDGLRALDVACRKASAFEVS